ncbi:Os07g0512000, partial [Oryza sativa Japonica Group]
MLHPISQDTWYWPKLLTSPRNMANIREEGSMIYYIFQSNARCYKLVALIYQTSIVFGLEEGPGILFKALSAFWMRDINLSKIESRPNKREPMRTQGNEKYATLLLHFQHSSLYVKNAYVYQIMEQKGKKWMCYQHFF